MNEGVNEGGDLALDDEVARGLQVGDDGTQPSTQLKWAIVNFIILNISYLLTLRKSPA